MPPMAPRMCGRDVFAAGDGFLDGSDIVRRDQRRVAGDLIQYARVRRAVVMIVHAARHLIMPAMEVGEKTHDAALARRRAGEPHRELRRFRSRRGKSYAFGRRDHLLDELRPFDFEFVRRGEMHAFAKLRLDRRQHLRMLVPKQQRTVTAVVIDVLVAVDVPFMRPQRVIAVDAVRRHAPRIVHDAARQRAARPAIEFRRARRARAIRRQNFRFACLVVCHDCAFGHC